MTSSGSFEVEVEQGGLSRRVRASLQTPGATTSLDLTLRSNRPARVTLRADIDATLQLRCGDRLLAVLPSGQEVATADIGPQIRDLHGELVIDVIAVDDLATEVLLHCITTPIEATPQTRMLRERIISDLDRIHVGLAHDVLGSSAQRMGWSGKARLFDPAAEHARLTSYERALSGALSTIGSQPSSILTRSRERARWRPGDLFDSGAIQSLVRDQQLVMRGGRALNVGTIDSRRTRMSLDLAEHRHIRAGLVFLARRSRRLSAACRRSAEYLMSEEQAWGAARRESPSIFEQRHAPRIRRFHDWAARGDSLGHRFGQMLDSHDFLVGVGEPRSQLEPTPIFMNRNGYREAYATLREVYSTHGLAVDTAEIQLRLRSLDTLYEYWTFIRTVAILRGMLGTPEPDVSFRIVDEMYRPDLEPRQSFRWTIEGRATLEAIYEPEIPPAHWHRSGPRGMCASLVSAPLRPDILLVLDRPGEPLRAIALDAKNTTSFSRDRLWEYSDYRTLIHDSRSGEQPVRWMFFLHRDEGSEMSSYPDFDRNQAIPPSTSILGGLPFMPDHTEPLTRLLGRFLAC